MTVEFEYDVFFSYSRTDAAIRDEILEIFNKEGLPSVWVDKKINTGDDWKEEIDKAIQNSYCLVLLASPDANVSRWVREELQTADTHKKPVYVVLIRGGETDIPFGYRRFQHVDIRGLSAEELAPKIKELAVFIKERSLGEDAVPTPPTEDAPEETTVAPTREIPVFSKRHLRFGEMVVVLRTLQAAAELLPNSTDRGRAALLWVDENEQELYLVAATNGFKDRELRLHFQRGRGFAGVVWESGGIEPVTDYPRKTSRQDMRVNLGLDDEEIELTRQIGVIVSFPIFIGGQLQGILSIDSRREIAEEELRALSIKVNNGSEQVSFYEAGRQFSNFFARYLSACQPLSFRKYRLLQSIITTARLLPPLAIPIRAAIFCADGAQDELFMLAGSEEFSAEWLAADDVRFKEGQGVVGTVWEKGQHYLDDRSDENLKAYLKERYREKRRDDNLKLYLEENWNMTLEQMGLAKSACSIVGMPIINYADDADDVDKVVAVLTVSSPHPMSETKLDEKHNLVTINELAKLVSKVLTSPDYSPD